MPDLFVRSEANYGGAMHAQLGIVGGGEGLGILMQNCQIQYSQNVTRIYELGQLGVPTKFYYVGGRSQGQCTVGHILGPGVAITAFYQKYGDLCQNQNLDLTFDNTCDGASIDWKMKSAVLINVGLSVAAQDVVINLQGTVMFSGLEVS